MSNLEFLSHKQLGTRQNATHASSMPYGKESSGGGKGGVVSVAGSGGGGGDHAYAAPPVSHSPSYVKASAEPAEAQTTWAQNAGKKIANHRICDRLK